MDRVSHLTPPLVRTHRPLWRRLVDYVTARDAAFRDARHVADLDDRLLQDVGLPPRTRPAWDAHSIMRR